MGLPSVYSGALTIFTLISPHISAVLFAMMSDVQEAPESVTVSGPLSRLREAMAEIFAEPRNALLPRLWLYLWSSEHRL